VTDGAAKASAAPQAGAAPEARAMSQARASRGRSVLATALAAFAGLLGLVAIACVASLADVARLVGGSSLTEWEIDHFALIAVMESAAFVALALGAVLHWVRRSRRSAGVLTAGAIAAILLAAGVIFVMDLPVILANVSH